MEWASNGSLSRAYRIIKTPQCPSFLKPTGLSIIICGIVLGMRFMHSRGFIHQDLKPSNILINDQGRVVIGDFGSSRNVNADITPVGGGTLQYAAPELGEEDD
jgi:serine/threonine protein kinase